MMILSKRRLEQKRSVATTTEGVDGVGLLRKLKSKYCHTYSLVLGAYRTKQATRCQPQVQKDTSEDMGSKILAASPTVQSYAQHAPTTADVHRAIVPAK